MKWFYTRKHRYYPYRLVKQTMNSGEIRFCVQYHVINRIWITDKVFYTQEKAEICVKKLYAGYCSTTIKKEEGIL